MSEQEICAVCNAPAQQKCSACKIIFYCSRQHQKYHWKEHAKKCKAFEIAEDDVVGRHYIATRKLKQGEIIVKELKALISGPQFGTFPVCLGCYDILSADNSKACDKCGWPLCKNCKDHGEECEFTINYRGEKVVISDFGLPHPTYKCICVVRALALRKSDPNAYQKLMNLQGNYNEDIATEEFIEVANFVKRFFKIEDIDVKEIAKIVGILQINGHEVPTTEPHHVAVYDIASYFEHNCQANCSKSFTNDGGIIIKTALPISKGEHITMCYTDPLWGVTNRRHHLKQTKYFDCNCERCQDPTEFGTHFNSLKCTNGDCGGSMLPSTFLIIDKNKPDYVCQKCKTSLSVDNVEDKLEKIGIELAEMKKNDIEVCKKFLNKYSKQLHDNHYYMVDVKMALSQIIGLQDGGLPAVNDDIINEKISLCKKLDELIQILAPAENRIRGLLLYEAHAAIAEYGRRQGQDQLKGMLVLAKKALEESYQLLRHEPEILPEGKIARIAFKNLNEIDMIIRTLCQNTANIL
ncbi:SET domain-containing protein SmydA-8-like [Aphidius gifuensis]|nr:SET domain-containing protein SmydA-8-like [Aphidius gifuensis]